MAVIVVRAHSNRLEALARLVPEVLALLETMPERTLRKVGP
jgi:hypothetical protein